MIKKIKRAQGNYDSKQFLIRNQKFAGSIDMISRRFVFNNSRKLRIIMVAQKCSKIYTQTLYYHQLLTDEQRNQYRENFRNMRIGHSLLIMITDHFVLIVDPNYRHDRYANSQRVHRLQDICHFYYRRVSDVIQEFKLNPSGRNSRPLFFGGGGNTPEGICRQVNLDYIYRAIYGRYNWDLNEPDQNFCKYVRITT
ncbi:hypothetical protein PVAND_008437 [Polypedilum vanderplanki]|uniref:Uncharacterized protein n=1 Tax=Polypedilum vanderplanki TaxID=319348 RepID=A0A9J6CAM5_POLVA|nr:hypothetical protein PVAND_008437 [Polypedilum vanderplanki]